MIRCEGHLVDGYSAFGTDVVRQVGDNAGSSATRRCSSVPWCVC